MNNHSTSLMSNCADIKAHNNFLFFSGPEQRHGCPGCCQSDRDKERGGAGGLHSRDRNLGYVQPSLHRQTARCILLRSEAMGEIKHVLLHSLTSEYTAASSLL